jgi:hypothetical protein
MQYASDGYHRATAEDIATSQAQATGAQSIGGDDATAPGAH